MKILAVDNGFKRIGLAVCDQLEIAASPLAMLKGGAGAEERILEVALAQSVGAIVIGLPISFDGEERKPCEYVRDLKERLEKITDLPIDLFDERLTSVMAESSLIEAGMSRKKRRENVDAVAASIILQGYLDMRRNKGIVP